MSYCVNCGVELAPSEPRCPLCGVEVINPRAPWQEPRDRPYPKQLETLMEHIDRRYFASLAGLILLIPVIVTAILDLISGGGITWSAYVTGAAALLFLWFLLPLYFRRYRTVLFLALDCAGVLLYLLFIEQMNSGAWFLSLGFPIALSGSVLVVAVALLFRLRRPRGFLHSAAAFLFASGIFVLCIDLILTANALGAPALHWSPYAFVPCILLGFAALLLARRRTLQEEIRRRLFF